MATPNGKQHPESRAFSQSNALEPKAFAFDFLWQQAFACGLPLESRGTIQQYIRRQESEAKYFRNRVPPRVADLFLLDSCPVHSYINFTKVSGAESANNHILQVRFCFDSWLRFLSLVSCVSAMPLCVRCPNLTFKLLMVAMCARNSRNAISLKSCVLLSSVSA